MCGIAGAVGGGTIDQALVERMTELLVHRGPDHGGLWRSEDGGACLGHRRLAILDLTSEANQPFISGDGRFVLTFNGEVYNHAALGRELAAGGTRLRTRSDTEVLIEAYARWGAACLERLHGMFAFAIWDRVERRLFCARDRAGEKPFHYAVIGDVFVFASELKALTAWPGFRRNPDHHAIADFLTFGFVPDPLTVWEGVRKLAPGHALEVDLPSDGRVRAGAPVRWWDLEFTPDRTVDDWGPEIRATLQETADDMSVADVPVGTFLSGGVDSSSVTAALALAERSVRTFTIGFTEQAYDERPWARVVAERYRTAHTERLVEPHDMETVLDRLHWHFDEPFNDHSYLPTYYVCREARGEVTVALTGDGGDEAFAGYRKYRRMAVRDALEPFVPPLAGGLMAGAATALLPATSRARHSLRGYGRDLRTLLGDSMVGVVPRAALRRAARGPLRAALEERGVEDVVAPLLDRTPPEEVGAINAMRYLDLKLTLGGGILAKVDRAAMAVSLETRPVYLHPSMLALAGRIPPERLAHRLEAKQLLKASLRPWLPDPLLYRPKAGFAMPLGTWLRNGLGPMGDTGPGPDPLDELLDPRFVAETTRAHATGRVDATAILHALGFLRGWMRRWL